MSSPESRRRPSFDEVFMDVVEVIARRGTCLRKQVAAVLAVDNRIISHGYNGVAGGKDHCIDTGICLKERYGSEDYKPCIHAEQNAICQCAKRGLPVLGGTLYVNADPCVTCAKLIASCGIARVVIRRDHHSGDGIEYLRDHGVEVCVTPDSEEI